ncbi:MAG: DMT family transporter [Alphaproteobacteria bacterium]|nr:DMT family transporter [Alphaproteobacteria bacterium]
MLLMLLSGVAVACMSGVIVHLVKTQHPVEVAFFRNILGLILLLPLLAGKGGMAHLRTGRLGPLVWRGMLSAISMMCYFYGVGLIPLAEVTALSFVGPLFATVIAVLVLGERIRLRRTVALVVGFSGALIILRPGFHEIGLGTLLIFGSAASWSISMIIIKVLTKTESALTQSIYTLVMLTPITGLAALPYWQTPNLEEFGWMIVMAALGTGAQLAFTEAFKLSDLTALLPLDFTKLIWAAMVGYLFFAQTPDIWVFIGGAVIFASTTYIALREAQIKRKAMAEVPELPV